MQERNPPAPAPVKKPAAPPPLRMGGRRPPPTGHKPPPKDKAVAEFRVGIYKAILALLDLLEKMTTEVLFQEDRYGLDWHRLARQVVLQYKADAIRHLASLKEMIMSKQGAQYLPKGLYRDLLAYLEECAEFLRAAQSPDFEESAGALAPNASAAEREGNPFHRACVRFKKACLEMQQHICIYENERAGSEESFFA